VDLADSGMGIPAQTMPHIFDAFVQSDSPIARRTGGLGLGLAIAKAIMDLHGGQIWAEGATGAGATFYFTLAGHES
jgi:signal transduction histidine kinase